MATVYRLVIRERERTVIALIRAHVATSATRVGEASEIAEIVWKLMHEIEETDAVQSARSHVHARARAGARLRANAREFRAALARETLPPPRSRARKAAPFEVEPDYVDASNAA